MGHIPSKAQTKGKTRSACWVDHGWIPTAKPKPKPKKQKVKILRCKAVDPKGSGLASDLALKLDEALGVDPGKKKKKSSKKRQRNKSHARAPNNSLKCPEAQMLVELKKELLLKKGLLPTCARRVAKRTGWSMGEIFVVIDRKFGGDESALISAPGGQS